MSSQLHHLQVQEVLSEFVALSTSNVSAADALSALDRAIDTGRITEANLPLLMESLAHLETHARSPDRCAHCGGEYLPRTNDKRACRVAHDFAGSVPQREGRSTYYRCNSCGTIGKEEDGDENGIRWARKYCFKGRHRGSAESSPETVNAHKQLSAGSSCHDKEGN